MRSDAGERLHVRHQPHLVNERDAADVLKDFFSHHIQSFNYMVEQGLDAMLREIKPVQVHGGLTIKFDRAVVLVPHEKHWRPLYPSECRQAKISYSGKLWIDISIQFSNKILEKKVYAGDLPIMVKSRVCNLRCADPIKLVSLHEDPLEMGGYFILNGDERVVRLQLLPKQNYPISMVDKSFQRNGTAFSDKAVVIRCVRKDMSSSTIKLYSLSTGSAKLGFRRGIKEFLIPVGIILKALVEATDKEIYHSLASCYDEEYAKKNECWFNNQFVHEKANILLGELGHQSLHTRAGCLNYIGEYVQRVMPDPETQTPAAVSSFRSIIMVLT